MKARIDKHKPLNMLVVEPDKGGDAPVLLFLHGKREASKYINELPLVFVHHSPPFQAIMGRLKDAIVVAPQAPHDPNTESNWGWSPYLKNLHNYLFKYFPQRKILATGFSRGGLGVLQLVQSFPQSVSKWAVVDPYQGNHSLFRDIAAVNGWVAYGPQFASIQTFSNQLSQYLDDKNVRSTSYSHGELAMKAYEGNKLGGVENIYEFLGLNYMSDAP